jgi:electron transfer flavoprotein alpha subunit
MTDSDYKGVLIIGEIVEDNLANITLELLGCGRALADKLGEKLSGLLMGTNIKAQASEAIAYGADEIYVVEDPLLEDYQGDLYLTEVEKTPWDAISPQGLDSVCRRLY